VDHRTRRLTDDESLHDLAVGLKPELAAHRRDTIDREATARALHVPAGYIGGVLEAGSMKAATP